VFGLILDTSDADVKVGAAKVGTEYTTGEGATKIGAGTPIPKLRNTFESAFDVVGSRKATKRIIRAIMIFFIFSLLSRIIWDY